MQAMVHWRFISAGLQNLSHQQLLNFTLYYAAANAILHQILWALLKVHDHQMWVELWPMFIGDLLGALLMLYAFKGLLRMLKPGTSSSSF